MELEGIPVKAVVLMLLTELRRYYEVKIKTQGMIRVGWTRPHLTAGTIVGTDQNSYSFDGHSVSC